MKIYAIYFHILKNTIDNINNFMTESNDKIYIIIILGMVGLFVYWYHTQHKNGNNCKKCEFMTNNKKKKKMDINKKQRVSFKKTNRVINYDTEIDDDNNSDVSLDSLDTNDRSIDKIKKNDTNANDKKSILKKNDKTNKNDDDDDSDDSLI